jgi:hypothetical protein
MIKVITLLKRKPGLSLDEFYRYWREQHAQLALKDHPEVLKYVQNHGVSPAASRGLSLQRFFRVVGLAQRF